VLDERIDLLAERPGVLLIQIDLELGAGQGEAHSLGCRTAVKIILK